MYDIHCHILYGCDDGSDDIESTVRMIQLASERGTKGIVATPHSNIPDSYLNYWDEKLENKFISICDEIKKREISVEIFKGQEIFCTRNTVTLLESGSLITLNGSRYPLVEFDFYEFSESVYTKLRSLKSAGYTPVVAHPERYAFVTEEPDAVTKLKDIGCLLQINKGSLEGRFGQAAYYASHRIISHRMADAVASDAHSPYMRTPNMIHTHELISEEYSYEYADLLLKENPYRIIHNKETVQY